MVMPPRERLLALAGLFIGVALTLALVDGLLLYASSIQAPQAGLLMGAKIGIIMTGLAVAASIFIRYRLRRG